jgi:hypothetical protein
MQGMRRRRSHTIDLRERADPSHCARHVMEPASESCERCANYFCSECVVFPFGVAKRALCIRCALGLAGVRTRFA